jgi:hypothetical protein
MNSNIAKLYAQILGGVFVLVGILGFIPALTPNNELLGIFAVNPAHNLVHLLSGIIAIATSFAASNQPSRLFALVFGIVYGLVTVLGFVLTPVSGNLLGLVATNGADNLLHTAITVASLGVYFATGNRGSQTARA